MTKAERLKDCVQRIQRQRRKAKSLTQVLPAMTTEQAKAALEVERGGPVTEAQVDEAIARAMARLKLRRKTA